MKTTMTLAANLNCNPFDIFNQSADEVIMLINFYIRIGEEKPQTENVSHKNNKETRIKVNDKTATGGWF